MQRARDLLAARLGVRRSLVPRVPSTFDASLRRHEDDRHARIVEQVSTPIVASSRNPAGWRAEDVLGCGDGFLALADAARFLRLSETETIEDCSRGLLEWDERGGTIYVRPAILSVLRCTGSQ